MHVYCHLPTSIARPDDLSHTQFDLLQQVILRAVRRAVSELELEDVRIEIVPDYQPAKREQQLPLDAQVDGEMETRTIPGEIQSGGEGEEQALMVVLPSSEAVGAMVVMDGMAAGHTTSWGDTLISEQFPWVPVVEHASDGVIYAGGAPYVRTANLARAMDWGEQLFSDSGFAVLQSQSAPSAGDFNVVGLLPSADSRNGLIMGEEEGKDVASEAVLLHPEGYSIVTVAQSEGTQIFGGAGRDLWDIALFNEVLNTSTTEQGQVDQSTMPQEDIFSGRAGSGSQRRAAQKDLPLTQGWMSSSPSVYVDEEMIDLIASMERTVFAAMPAEKRRECLTLMINAWNGERDEQTLIEILHAAQEAAELRMLLALLSRAGLYEQLFVRLTQGVYELLKQIGASQTEQSLDWRYLLDALPALGIELPELGSRLALVELQQIAAAFANLIEQASSEIQHVVTTIDLADNVQGVSAFFWMVQQAQADDPGAQTLLTNLVGETCTLPAQAIRGLDAIEQLSGSYRRENVEPGSTKTVRQSLSIASVVLVVQQFMKSDLMRGAMQAGSTLSERLRWLAVTMRV